MAGPANPVILANLNSAIASGVEASSNQDGKWEVDHLIGKHSAHEDSTYLGSQRQSLSFSHKALPSRAICVGYFGSSVT